jgi:hypothetical protein
VLSLHYDSWPVFIRPRKSRFWYPSYRDAADKQHLVSTKIETAPVAGSPRERAAKASENKRLAMEMALREMLATSFRRCASVGLPRSSSSRRVNKRRMEFATVEANLRQWLTRVEKGNSAATYLRYKGTVDEFLLSLGSKAQAALTSRDVERFVEMRQNNGRSATTIDTDLKALKRPFSIALRQGLILSNPVTAADQPKASKEPKDPFTIDQLKAIFKTRRRTVENRHTDWALHFSTAW